MPTLAHKTAIAYGLMFPQVARQGPAQTFTLVATREARTLPMAAGTAAVIADADGGATRQPALAYRVQLFERTGQTGQHADWCVAAEPIGADGSTVRYDCLELADGSSAYLEMLVGEDRDELIREALAGALLVVIDNDDTIDAVEPDEDCSADVDELMHARAAGAPFTQGE
ncbi:hypothetical protein AB4Y42_05500 [Paraburkholderia sp. EG286B]|uniref:hypothetical protein n=1 Tax=Paraburkholderia sp. EG286B TaxID=3237011 RepID=UPI0034D162D0